MTSLIKEEIYFQIQETLEAAQTLLPVAARYEIRTRLLSLQAYCKMVEKTFIFVEQRVTCDQYGLGGEAWAGATLFRGPKEDASVAICITDQGSLLHRNGDRWRIYQDAGDVEPEQVQEFAYAS